MINWKFIGLLIVMLAFHAISFNQTTKSQTRQELNLRNEVKSLHQIDHELTISNGDRILGDTLAFKEIYFNEAGRVIKKLSKEYGSPNTVFTIYDIMGYDSIIVKNAYDSTFIINEYWKGLLMKSEEDSIGKGPRPFKRFGYNSDNKRSFETYYNADKRLIYTYNYDYNKIGLLIENRFSCCDSSTQDFFKTLVGFQYEYDRNFNIIKSTEYTPDYKQKRTHYYTYDKGIILKDSLVTYFYDISLKRNKKMNLSDQNRVITYVLNEQGDVTKEIWDYEFAKTKTESFSYVYDDQNNWIERIRYCNKEAVQITKRDINYY